MTNYKEILRLHSLGINNTRVAESCGCARSTVISTVQRAQEKGITWEDIRSLGEAEVARKLYPAASMGAYAAAELQLDRRLVWPTASSIPHPLN